MLLCSYKASNLIHMKSLLENYSFGVCSYLADKIGLSVSRVRLYFIYLSFLAIGYTFLAYLVVAFWINIKRYIRKGHIWVVR